MKGWVNHMKLTKLTSALIAAAAAFTPLTLNSSVLPAPAASAASAEAAATLPDWVPKDLESAVSFRNNYGATHIDNGLVCVVYKLEREPVPADEVQGIVRYELQATDPSVKLLRHMSYGSADSSYYFETAVFDPQQACDFDIAVIDTFVEKTDSDLRYGHAIARYSFSAADDMHITETDIFGWLPDCTEEYRLFSRGNGSVSVKDNYIVFCMTAIPQFSDRWEPDSTNTYENVKFAASASCTMEAAEPYDDGSIDRVYAYQALKDGYEKISWTRTSGTRPEQENPEPYTVTADCVIFDNAQTVLLSGQMRTSLADYDTGRLIPLSADKTIFISTDITAQTPEGPVSAGPILSMESNPAIVDDDLGRMCRSDSFSFWLDKWQLPDGYEFPDNADTVYYHNGTIVPKDGMTVTVFDNDAANVIFRAKQAGQTDLQPGQVRVTLIDADTAEPIIIQNDSDTDFDFVLFRECDLGTDYVENPAVTGLKTNPTVISYADLSPDRSYDFHLSLSGEIQPVYSALRETPKITRYANHSYDVVFRLKFTPGGDVNGDGQFNSADAELLQKWLLADPDAKLNVWKAGDFRNDNRLDAADLSLMKRALLQAAKTPVAVSAVEEGGAAGAAIQYKVYREGESCRLSRLDRTTAPDAEPVVIRIASADYHEIMSQDYDSMIRNMTDSSGPEWSEIRFSLEVSYADGSQKKAVSSRNPAVLTKLNALWEQYITNNGTYVEPDERFEYGVLLRVLEDGLRMYTGPDESYPSVASIPADTQLFELGGKKDYPTWLFTEYNGQYGWISTVKGDNADPTVFFEVAAKKPVIYLYPEQETDVHVELELTESDLHTTYPKYDNGWDVTAYPDGTLVNKADGSRHRSLFWDSENCRTRFDFSEGFCVTGCDTERFLKEKLTFMGLNENEMNEFIVYWLPLMEHHAYNLIAFQDKAYTDSAKLTVTPAPDSECRIFMAYIPLEEAVEIEPQQLETFERTGFAVVEWGGAEVRH